MSSRADTSRCTSKTHGQDSVSVMGLSCRTVAKTWQRPLKEVPQTVTDPYRVMGARILWES
jgi:hypothetical protein